MKHRISMLFIILLPNIVFSLFDIQDIISEKMNRLPKDFSVAINDIAESLPTKTMMVVRGNSTKIRQVMCRKKLEIPED